MVKGKYGSFSKDQIAAYKKKLHNKIHWLLIYKENDCDGLEEYTVSLLHYINSLNEIFNYDDEIIELMINIQQALDELTCQDFDFKRYRKYILDAHALVDKIKEE